MSERVGGTAVAFLVSAAFFAVAAVAIPIRHDTVLVIVLGGAYVAVALVAARRWGPLYGVPLAIAAGLALDSFYIPPVRAFGADVWQNWLVIAIYIAVGVVIGMLAAETQRRARASERARGLLADELAGSRARLVAAADDERRRVVRDLHDGAQQRLIHTVITLKLATRALESDHVVAPELLAEALDNAQRATVELRELAHGIMPAVLTRGGLRGAVDALASRMSLPVDVSVTVDRLPPTVEATAYFVIAEALTNVVKHSGATRATVTARVQDGTLSLDVRDDGVGGARSDGSGLLGLADRLAVLHGRLRVDSPLDGGTVITAAVPVTSNGSQRGG